MQSSLIINSTSRDGKKLQKTITNLNPAATNAKLGEFAQRLTALTTNEYQGASRIDKTNVTEEGGGITPATGGLLDPQLTVTASPDTESIGDTIYTVSWLGNGAIHAYKIETGGDLNISGDTFSTMEEFEENVGTWYLVVVESDGTYAQAWWSNFDEVNG